MSDKAPKFLTIVYAEFSPAIKPFNIKFDASKFNPKTDFGSHTVAYTVASSEYSSTVAQITGSFKFEVTCPTQITGSTLTETLESFKQDISLPSVEITLPVLVVEP